MFTLSTKVVYGVAAVFELALSEGKGPLQARDIARAQGIPEDYLRQLMAMLKRAKIVESIRGVQGGYILKRRASEITIGEIMACLEGHPNFTRIRIRDRTLVSYFKEREKEIEGLFETSLEGLALDRQRCEQNVIYHI
jgi:Rrf2 family protein